MQKNWFQRKETKGTPTRHSLRNDTTPAPAHASVTTGGVSLTNFIWNNFFSSYAPFVDTRSWYSLCFSQSCFTSMVSQLMNFTHNFLPEVMFPHEVLFCRYTVKFNPNPHTVPCVPNRYGKRGACAGLSYSLTPLWIPIYNYSYRKFIYVSILKPRR
jgi:hypothetical protein